MGGKFGEMSTFLNYTFQSFNFRDRQKAFPDCGKRLIKYMVLRGEVVLERRTTLRRED